MVPAAFGRLSRAAGMATYERAETRLHFGPGGAVPSGLQPGLQQLTLPTALASQRAPDRIPAGIVECCELLMFSFTCQQRANA